MTGRVVTCARAKLGDANEEETIRSDTQKCFYLACLHMPVHLGVDVGQKVVLAPESFVAR
jgi:hypothetical protein